MSQIVGILGEKRHGKDTFARFVVDHNPEFRVTHFAKELKRMCGELWGLTHDQMNGDSKETPFPTPVEMDLQLEAMRKITGLPGIRPAGMIARVPREVLQFFGTEYVRSTQDDYWVEQVRREARQGGMLLVPDTRYKNEADAVRDLGGWLIKIVRTDLPSSGDRHSSEQEQAALTPDITVYTRTGDLAPSLAVARAVASGLLAHRR